MFLISAIAYLDRVNISIAGGAIQKDFNLDNVQLGWVFSSFVLGYALFQAPGGRLADRFGPRKMLAIGTVWWGVFTAFTAMVPAGIAGLLVLLITVRFVLGMGEAVVYPASNSLVSAWIPSQERGIANGLIFCGVGAGAGVTPRLITYILENYGWRWSFWISATIGLAAGIVWYLIARDKPEEHPWVEKPELEFIRAGLPKHSKSGSHSGAVPWGSIFRSADLVAVSLSYFAYGYSAYIFFTWFFLYLNKARGLDLKASAFYTMLPFLAMATGSLVGGWISDQLTKRSGKRLGRCYFATFGMALCAIFIGSATFVEDARLASIVLAGGAGALYLSQSSFWSVTADLAGPSAGAVSGVMNMCGQFGGVVTASATPWIADHFGWSQSFLTAGGLCLVGSVLWLMVKPERELVR